MPLIKVNKNCIGCGMCINACPTKVFSLDNKKSIPIREKNCIECGHCIGVCPTDSIRHKNIEFSKSDKIKFHPNLIQTEQILRHRRSIRNFKNKQIPKNQIEKIINVARFAPTGHNKQSIEYLIVQQSKQKEIIRQYVLNFYKRNISLFNNLFIRNALKPIIGRKKVNSVVGGLDVFKSLVNQDEKGNDILFYNAPSIILVHAKKDHFAKDDSIYASTYLMHAADALGISSCIIGFAQAAFDNSKPNKQIGIPLENKIYNTIILGYPNYNYKRTPERKKAKFKFV